MKSLFIIPLLFSYVSAWWDTGHLLVARIAYDILEFNHPQTIYAAENILRVLSKATTNYTREGAHPFVECATFADEVQKDGKGGEYNFPWHFIDQPYFDKGGNRSTYPGYVEDPHNVTQAIPEIVSWLRGDDGFQFTYIYQTIMKHGKAPYTDEIGKSIALRFLIHYLGDIHQPLHTVSRVDDQYPKGDMGGNLFNLTEKDGITELHAVWDSVIYEFEGYANLPFNDSDWQNLGNTAKSLVDKYSPDLLEVKDLYYLDPAQWALDHYQITKDFVYKDIAENTLLSAEYISQARTIAER